MMVATSAMAQKTFTGSVDCYSTAGYTQKYITFSLSDIAKELDTDTASLVAALNEQVDNFVADTIFEVQDIDPMIYNVPDGKTRSAFYTQGSVGGFWMDANSTPVKWGSANGCKWFNTMSWSATEDAFVIGVGQFPDATTSGEKYSTTFVLEYNDKSVNFGITLNVTEKPAVDVTPIRSKLNLLATPTPAGGASQYVRNSYDGDYVKISLDGAAAKLGLDEATLSANLSDYLYCTAYDVTNEVIKDSLTNTSTAAALGWWLAQVYDENTGETTDQCGAVAYGTQNVFYVQSITYSSDTLSVQIGQYPSTLKEGSNLYTYLYLINGTKAVRIKVSLNVLVKEKSDTTFDKMTRVGGEEIAYVRDPSNGYGADTYYFDADSIAKLFGDDVSSSELTLQALTAENELTDSYTANGGFWMDLESHPVTWGPTDAYCAEYTYNASGKSYLNICNMPSSTIAIETVTKGSIFLVLDDKYYEFAMRVQMGEKETSDYTVATCKTVATYKYEYQIIPDASAYQDYTKQDTTIFLDMTEVASLLGTSTPSFYAETYPDSTGNIFTKTYSCAPNPGFWMDPDTTAQNRSVASVWGTTNTYGICFTDNYFQFFQLPNSSSVAAGKHFTDNFYLVNLKDGKKIQYTITVKFVEELTKHTNVGQEQIAGKARGEEGCALADIDLTAMYTAFGCTEEEFEAAGSWVAPNASGTYSDENYDALEGFFFAADGTTVSDGTEVVHAGVNEDGQLATYIVDDANLDNEYTVTFAALYNDQMYYFYVTINKDGVPSAIEGIKAGTAKSGVIYDLSGRKVVTPTKGVYIQNGKKFLVK